MAEQLTRIIAEVEYDGLLDAAYSNHTVGVTVLAGQGELKRGTVLAINADNKAVIASGAEGTECRYILRKDIDAAEADTVAYAYDEGRFIKSHLIVGEGYTLTPADIDALRTHNICLADEL
jgi:hypothetical protein